MASVSALRNCVAERSAEARKVASRDSKQQEKDEESWKMRENVRKLMKMGWFSHWFRVTQLLEAPGQGGVLDPQLFGFLLDPAESST